GSPRPAAGRGAGGEGVCCLLCWGNAGRHNERWQYKLLGFSPDSQCVLTESTIDEEEMEGALNELGWEGWELAGVVETIDLRATLATYCCCSSVRCRRS